MTRTGMASDALRRWAACVAALMAVAGLFLPYFSLGRSTRSMWQFVSAASELGLTNTALQSLAVAVVRALPILVGLLCCVVAFRLRVLAVVLSTVIGFVGIGLGIAGVALGGELLASAVFLVSGVVALLASWLIPRRLPSEGVGARWLVGAVALVGGVVLSVQSPGTIGASEPTEAARIMMEALDDRDPIRVLEVLAPGERAALVQSAATAFTEVRRLRVVSSSSRRLTRGPRSFSVDQIHDDLAVVKMTAGKVPDVFRTQNISIGKQLNVVRVDQRWFVSIGASLAENMRRGWKAPQVERPQAVTSLGADSPVAAVQVFLEAAGAFDLEAALPLIDPHEIEATADYLPIVIGHYRKQTENLRADYQLSFPDIELLSNTDGDIATVKVNRWSAELTLNAEQVDDSIIGLEGECVTVSVAGDDALERCGKDAPLVLGDVFGVSARPLTTEQQRWLSDPLTLPGIVTVRRDGAWFVSPTRTLMGFLADWLQGLTAADVTGAGNTLPDRLRSALKTLGDLSSAAAPGG